MRTGDLIQERYELREQLGVGGMAEVWLAEDLRLNRPVALKFLSSGFTGDPESLVRFFSEAQSIARIQHPNVVTVLDFGEAGDCPYLAMEHVVGGPLTEITGQPLLPERALEIVSDAAAAAGAAHSLGIVHRDIKPGNILLDEAGNAKLCDFGIASSTRAAERLTASGVAIGSPHYISPEQASGGEATPASDVYALGVVLYELLTGVRPFEGPNMTAIVIAHVEREPDPPSTHVPGLPPALDALVLRCLAKEPSERYADGHALGAATARLNDVGTAEQTAWAPAETGTPRPRKRVALGIAALAALGGLVAWRGIGFDEGGPAETETHTENSSSGISTIRDRGQAGPGGVETGDAGSSSPTGSSPAPAVTTETEAPPGDDRAEGEEDAEEEAEPEPSPTAEPEPEPTPAPDVVTPTPDPTGTEQPSTS